MRGPSTRRVEPGATLRIHSGLGGEIDKAENFLRRYVVRMGVDPALVDAAAKTPSRSFRGLSRGEGTVRYRDPRRLRNAVVRLPWTGRRISFVEIPYLSDW